MAGEGTEGFIIQEKEEIGSPIVIGGKTPKGKKAAPKKKEVDLPTKSDEDDGKKFGNLPLTGAELDTFNMALIEFSKLTDSAIWHLGLDTDPDVPDMNGNPGVPIWEMDEKEAAKVTGLFLAIGKNRPEVYKAMRSVNIAYDYMLGGMILGSRFYETVIRVFEVGINFRMSKPAWIRSVNEAVKAGKISNGTSNAASS